MRSARKLAILAALLIAGAGPARGQASQGGTASPAALAVGRGLDLENSGKSREAIAEYRKALGDGDQVVAAMLGLERCWSQVGHPDSLIPVLDSALSRRPQNPTLRAVQLRTLTALHRDDEVQRAFDQWVAFAPRDAAPYREYARMLLDDGRTKAADTVLQEATRTLGGTRELAAELAQLRAALGLWYASARNWREAMGLSPYLEQAAIFSLMPVPPPSRDSVRAVFLAEPAELLARKVLAGLELRWRSPRDAWLALSTLPPTDSTVAAWVDFAAEAELTEAWLTARDAYAAALKHGARKDIAIRAASAAMQGGEPASALELLSAAGSMLTDSTAAGSAALLQIRALGLLGRPMVAESVFAARSSQLDPEARAQAIRAVAWGWVRVGDLAKARAALAEAPGEDEDRVSAWIALYEGDLKTARTGLRRTDETTRDAVLAMSFLARTRAETSRDAGGAFLALAKGDSAGAAQRFVSAATELSDATPLLLGVAARLYVAMRDTTRSLELWKTLVEKFADAPEAAEADLEWARYLRRGGDAASAVARLEHLIMTWPQSALVPQARRELDLAKGAVPPARSGERT